MPFGRAEVEDTSFENSDLSQSLLSWTDFIRVSFARADIHDSDMRSSTFDGCDFSGAVLDDCDLRSSEFSACRFDGASLCGATVTEKQRKTLPLSDQQRLSLTIDSDDDAPGG